MKLRKILSGIVFILGGVVCALIAPWFSSPGLYIAACLFVGTISASIIIPLQI